MNWDSSTWRSGCVFKWESCYRCVSQFNTCRMLRVRKNVYLLILVQSYVILNRAIYIYICRNFRIILASSFFLHILIVNGEFCQLLLIMLACSAESISLMAGMTASLDVFWTSDSEKNKSEFKSGCVQAYQFRHIKTLLAKEMSTQQSGDAVTIPLGLISSVNFI